MDDTVPKTQVSAESSRTKLQELHFFHFIFLQGAELQKQQQESQAARLADLELLLKALSAKTEVCTAGLLLCH